MAALLSLLAFLYLPKQASWSQDDQDSAAVVAVPSSSQGIHLPVWSSLGCTRFGLYFLLCCCALDKSRVALSKLEIADICMTVCMLDGDQEPLSAPRPPSALRGTHLLFIINGKRHFSETGEPHFSLSRSLSHLYLLFNCVRGRLS